MLSTITEAVSHRFLNKSTIQRMALAVRVVVPLGSSYALAAAFKCWSAGSAIAAGFIAAAVHGLFDGIVGALLADAIS